MSCYDRDQDVLLLVHGELSGPRRLLTQWHVRRCPGCCERHERLHRVSGLMAGAIRSDDGLPTWHTATAAMPFAPIAPAPSFAAWVAHVLTTPLSARQGAVVVSVAFLLALAGVAGALVLRNGRVTGGPAYRMVPLLAGEVATPCEVKSPPGAPGTLVPLSSAPCVDNAPSPLGTPAPERVRPIIRSTP